MKHNLIDEFVKVCKSDEPDKIFWMGSQHFLLVDQFQRVDIDGWDMGSSTLKSYVSVRERLLIQVMGGDTIHEFNVILLDGTIERRAVLFGALSSQLNGEYYRLV